MKNATATSQGSSRFMVSVGDKALEIPDSIQ